jgi:hypothetical protein
MRPVNDEELRVNAWRAYEEYYGLCRRAPVQ